MNQVIAFTYDHIKGELFRLKSKEMKTNFFLTEVQFNHLLSEDKMKFYKTDDACFLLIEDFGFKRLYFIVKQYNDILPFLDFVQSMDEEISVEIAGKTEYLTDIKKVFLNNGFYQYSSMIRMSKMRKDNNKIDWENIHLLSQDKKEEIQMLYQRYFDKFVERIPTSQEIEHFIQNKNIYYFSDDGKIQGFIVFEVYGATSHLRYWFVHPDYREKRIGSKLISLFFNQGEDVKREIFWVIENNENAIKRYKHFGFTEENMYNIIFVNKNIKNER